MYEALGTYSDILKQQQRAIQQQLVAQGLVSSGMSAERIERVLHDPDGHEFKGSRQDWLVRHVFLSGDPVEEAKRFYVYRGITVEELEMLLDAVLLDKGCEAAVRCPRCGAPCKGFASTDDKSLIAVRCTTPDCHFVGYAEA